MVGGGGGWEGHTLGFIAVYVGPAALITFGEKN
jgi:hypothetical protein